MSKRNSCFPRLHVLLQTLLDCVWTPGLGTLDHNNNDNKPRNRYSDSELVKLKEYTFYSTVGQHYPFIGLFYSGEVWIVCRPRVFHNRGDVRRSSISYLRTTEVSVYRLSYKFSLFFVQGLPISPSDGTDRGPRSWEPPTRPFGDFPEDVKRLTPGPSRPRGAPTDNVVFPDLPCCLSLVP